MEIATVIHTELTALLYLIVAGPLCFAALLALRKPLIAGLTGSILAMMLTSVLRYRLPFDYWAHANDFIIELFYQGKALHEPVAAMLSLLFHVGLPLAGTFFIARFFRPNHRDSVIAK